MQVGTGFDVDGYSVCAGSGESRNQPVRSFDHQVDIQRKVRNPAAGFDDPRPHRQVRDEMAVHDVDVDPVCAAGFGLMNGVPQRGEIGREDRGRDQGLHLHTCCLSLRR